MNYAEVERHFALPLPLHFPFFALFSFFEDCGRTDSKTAATKRKPK